MRLFLINLYIKEIKQKPKEIQNVDHDMKALREEIATIEKKFPKLEEKITEEVQAYLNIIKADLQRGILHFLSRAN